MPVDAVNSGDLPVNVLPKIMVFGVGGAGVNVVNDMILSQLEAVKFVVANTDCQSLVKSLAETKIQLGAKCTKGLGAGSNPDIGKQAAEEAMDLIKRELADTDMLFIAAGMGGGTGTGASPVIAKIARDMGVLPVAIAIKPFAYEGEKRMNTANQGITEIEKLVDTLIIIENEKVASLNNVSLAENYAIVNNILRHAVYCVVDILTKTGFVNRDFADVKTVLSSCGRAVIGYGEDTDPCVATETAIHNPILTNCSINGAKNILVNITGNSSLKSSDISAIVNKIKEEAKTEPNIIPGIIFDEAVGDNIRVSIIAAGVEEPKSAENVDVKNVGSMNSYKNNIEKNILKHNDTHLNEDNKPVENPVFAHKINEDEIIADCETLDNIEDIPSSFDDNVANFNDIKKEEKKKINKTNENNDAQDNNKNDNVFNLFSNSERKQQKRGFFDKVLNVISSSPTNVFEDDVENAFQKADDENNDIYNIPAIKRQKFGN